MLIPVKSYEINHPASRWSQMPPGKCGDSELFLNMASQVVQYIYYSHDCGQLCVHDPKRHSRKTRVSTFAVIRSLPFSSSSSLPPLGSVLSFFYSAGSHLGNVESYWDFLFVCLFRFREGKGEREGEKHQCVVASRTPRTGDLAHDTGMCPTLGVEPATLWFTGWHSTTEPHQSGLESYCLSDFVMVICLLYRICFTDTHRIQP